MKLEILSILPLLKDKSVVKIRASQGDEVVLDKFQEVDAGHEVTDPEKAAAESVEERTLTARPRKRKR